jgi:ribose 5-phosphate isomerase A
VQVDLDQEKLFAAEAAVRRVRPGMRVALGTGSSAAFAVRALSLKFPAGADLTCVASSSVTERLARELGLSVVPLAAHATFDVMLDGADEVTPALDLTKGGGGALFREKFLARLSKDVVIIVDHSKLVPGIGSRSSIPIEVVPFAREVLVAMLESEGIAAMVRIAPGSEDPFRTDNGNEILDLRMREPVRDPKGLDVRLRSLAGVVETGIFSGIASRVFVGLPDGTVEEILPPHARPEP